MIAMALLWPWWWPGVVAAALLWAIAAWRLARRRRRREPPLGARTTALAGRPAFARTRLLLHALAVALVLLALLQPVWGRARGEVVGADVVVCLDVSLSMAARDVPATRFGTSRFAAAQAEIEALAAAATGARLGLVVFGGTARRLVPLTGDGAAVAQTAATLAPGLVRGGTDLGAAIDAGVASLRSANAFATAPAIVLLTDGEAFGDSGRLAAARAREAGVTVHCVGIGSAAGSKVVIDGDGGEVFLRDGQGHDVVSRVDVDGLRAVVAAGGGDLLRIDGPAVAPASPLAELYRRALGPAAEAGALAAGDPRLRPAHRYAWFVGAALLAWLAATRLPPRRR